MIQTGIDYYPEQWDRALWERDADRIQETGVHVVRMAEFAWSRMEPADGQFDFAWLDEAIELFRARGIGVILGTPTNCAPRWLYQKYPDTLQCGVDGRITDTGLRGHRCMVSPRFRQYAGRIVEEMAKRYAGKPGIVGWQIDNELASGHCTCPACRDSFRAWVQKKHGSLEALNRAWGTAMWSGDYSAWEQVQPPLSAENRPDWYNPAFMLDYERWAADSTADFVRFQCDILRRYDPAAVITTNACFPQHIPDFHKEFAPLNVASYDNYPPVRLPDDPEELYSNAFALDFVRGFKQKNFWIMEQLGGPMGGWAPITPALEPGMLEGYALQAVAHGADLVSFFRWRTATSGAEMFCHGILDHDNQTNRRLRELETLCRRLRALPGLAGTVLRSPAAILYSADQEFALKNQWQSQGFAYWTQLRLFHDACAGLGVNVDVIEEHAPLDSYKVVMVPAHFITDPAVVTHLEDFSRKGGTVIVTCRSGVKDKNGNAILGQPLPTLLRDLCGCRVAEYDAIGTECQRIAMERGDCYRVTGWCDMLAPDTAQVVARYQGRFYNGTPAITRNLFGEGCAYYVGTVGERAMYRTLLIDIFRKNDVPLLWMPQGMEATTRTGADGDYQFIFNNTSREQSFRLGERELCWQPFEMKIFGPGRN